MASASTTLLSAAGLPGGRYFFEGCLPAGRQRLQPFLTQAGTGGQAFMLFEAPHRIEALAAELLQALEPEREVVMGRELTKRFEQIVRMPSVCAPASALAGRIVEPVRARTRARAASYVA